MQVRFLQRYGAYWPGANPVLDAVEAARLIAGGYCEPFDKPTPPVVEPPAVDVDATPDEPTEVEAPAPEDKPEPSAGIRKRGRRS